MGMLSQRAGWRQAATRQMVPATAGLPPRLPHTLAPPQSLHSQDLTLAEVRFASAAL